MGEKLISSHEKLPQVDVRSGIKHNTSDNLRRPLLTVNGVPVREALFHGLRWVTVPGGTV